MDSSFDEVFKEENETIHVACRNGLFMVRVERLGIDHESIVFSQNQAAWIHTMLGLTLAACVEEE
jgi:hypothetical protein